ncbi:hypothetical protein SDRG_06473 [Saprolegnia diclina VS20]|uniref:Alpha-soluble NSF attachment protein n=1 Tax=Saprolegnia diclina (strain VS20) TaxID=1156394 RepID=T0QEM8_SAPDV|nr:hypothetical protein SDRG_06473 [Saprolegnia diclina VS20]EQC36369.1 hypothetical protein SDRG_06473 [Saprolegnia diclina VS20]|eukprot:XP_008610475.1 hypothetical protein SDRG_06473 [Saprolegnia diclina VS20]
MAAQAEIKAEDFIKAGEKALNRFSIFSSSSKYEDASECFEKAANQFKIAKKWQESGECFARCADCQMRLKESSRAAQFYQQAAEATSKANPLDAITYYKTAISMQCEAGRFSNAAKLQKQIAEIYEHGDHMQDALEAYGQAAEYFVGENQNSSAQPMFLKVAQFSAQLEKYPEAMEINEKVARSAMENNLLKYNAKSHLMNAAICALATKDMVLVKQKLDEYNDIDYSFGDSREGKFVAAMATAYETFNTDGFSDAVYEFDTITKLDPWKVTILLRVKEAIAGDMHDDLT